MKNDCGTLQLRKAVYRSKVKTYIVQIYILSKGVTRVIDSANFGLPNFAQEVLRK